MAKYIDADTVVSMPFLDDSYGIEKHTMETDTIENLLDRFTKEGCPESADVVSASAYNQVMLERDTAGWIIAILCMMLIERIRGNKDD